MTQLKTGEDSEPLTVERVYREFGHITLTETEKADALLYAFRKKIAALNEQEKETARAKRIEEISRMWTQKECYDYALQRGKAIAEQRGFDFVLDNGNSHVFYLLSLFFSNDPKFEEYSYNTANYSLGKGICLLSPVRGNGKTTLLDCFMYNRRGCFGKQSTKRMQKDYERHGIDAVEKFMWLLPLSSSAMNFYQDKAGIHYDDFGDEGEVMFMGNRRFISSMIINSIYDEHRDENFFWRFHISMNYKWSEFEQKYGSNAASRMVEMFNLIPVPGTDRRK